MEHDIKQAVVAAEQLISDLERRRAEAETAVAALIERRKPLALGAATGDEASHKMLARLSDQERSAEATARDLGFAVSAARSQLDQAKASAAAADLHRRQALYAEHAANAVAASVSMDEASRALVAARAKLVAAHAGMASTGVANSALNRLVFRSSGSHALAAHGFATFVDLPRGGPLNERAFFDLVSGVVGAARSTREAA